MSEVWRKWLRLIGQRGLELLGLLALLMSKVWRKRSWLLGRQGLKLLGVLLLLVVLMMWLAGGFNKKVQPGPPLPKPHPPRFTTQRVERRLYPLVIDQVGNLRAMTEALVSSRIMAEVKEILVREGDRVFGGESKENPPTAMALLDDRDARARLNQAQAQAVAMERAMEAAESRLGAARAQVEAAKANEAQALADFERYQNLYENQAATGQQLTHFRAQMEIAQAKVHAALKETEAAQREIEKIRAQKRDAAATIAAARVVLSYTVIYAPFTGRVVKKMVNVGDMASPGQPLFFLEIASRPELHAFVSDSLVPRLRLGQEMDVHIDALKQTFRGTLREIIPKSDPATRTVEVKVALAPMPELVNGLFGRLAVVYGEYEALVVPIDAVREVGQLYLVEVVSAEGQPERRFVTLGQRHDGMVEILSGLKENEEIVVR